LSLEGGGFRGVVPAVHRALVEGARASLREHFERSPTLVDRYRDEFVGLIRNRMVDIVFANEHELKSLYQASAFEDALAALRQENILAVVTRSEKGALAVTPEGVIEEPVFPIERLVDATGAGDLFAAGFLFGLTSGREVRDSLRLGALAAAEIISHVGARPDVNLKVLAGNEGLL
jgi:sugar/nucleoside kinase (ribokinase family)